MDADDPLALREGERVSVSPDDYGKVPVVGELWTLSLTEVAVDARMREWVTVVTHFPRIGYRIERV